MTHVVPFIQRNITTPVRRPAAGPATIIIFPGVRYEREEPGDRPEDHSPRKSGSPAETSSQTAT